MPRIARRNITSAYIHVITQGINKEYIFEKEEYKKEYIKLLNEVFKEYNNLHILAYCIMGNHAHILVYTEEILDLSKAMGRVNSSYGIFYNKNEKRVGYVFRDRYYIQEIMDESHLYNAVAYIHRNPVKADMVKEMKDYLYSSYNDMKNGKVSKDVIDLLFHSNDYLEKFDFIHRNFKEDDILEIGEEYASDEEIRDFLQSFCQNRQVEADEVKKNNEYLNNFVHELKSKYQVKNKQIVKTLGIGKNRISNLQRAKKSE